MSDFYRKQDVQGWIDGRLSSINVRRELKLPIDSEVFMLKTFRLWTERPIFSTRYLTKNSKEFREEKIS